MDIETYLKRPGALSPSGIARAAGIHRSTICHIRKGRATSVETALAIEAATNGLIDAAYYVEEISIARDPQRLKAWADYRARPNFEEANND